MMNKNDACPLFEGIELSHADRIATVTIRNTRRRNALTMKMWEKLQEVFLSLQKRDDISCVVVRGAGGNFAAGADILEFSAVRATKAQVADFHELCVGGALAAIDEMPVPVIALIEGACAGGGLEIASVCDLRYAGRSAKLGIPIRTLGFPLALGEMAHLHRLFGAALTAELLLEGRMLDAPTALAKGLVTDVVEDEMVVARTYAAADAVASSAPLAVRTHKAQLRRLRDDARPVSLEERMATYVFADSEDYQIGLQAFRDKTRPVFVGR